MSIIIRPPREDEFGAIGEIFFETIREVNLRDYTAAQVAAWAPAVWPAEDWRKRLSGQTVLVAADGPLVVGFITIESDGHIDFLFVHKGRQRQGIGSSLLDRIIEQARRWGLDEVFTEASITAKLLFESRGFGVVQAEDVVRHGVTLRRYRLRYGLRRGGE